MLSITYSTKILISDTDISENSGYFTGAMQILENSSLEIYRSQIEGNSAEMSTGALYISGSSIFVAVNSSFKENNAYIDSTISITNSTVYLEKCTFMQNRLTNGGTIFTDPRTTLKVSNTVFTQNIGYEIMYYFLKGYLISKLETYRCLFIHGHISLKSDVKNFEEVAFNEKIIGQIPILNQSLFKSGETPYASSKMYLTLNVFGYCKIELV